MAVRRALRSTGLDVSFTEVQNVTDALKALREDFFDCAFLDYQLPGGDGMRVLQEARAAGISTPIVMLTGQGDEEVAVELMKAGASDYLAKSSVSPDRLEQALRRAVRVRRAEEQTERAEKALRLSEQRFRSLVEASAQAVWTLGPAGEATDNPQWTALTGQHASEMAGDGWMDAIHADDVEPSREAWKTAIARGEPFEIEQRVRTREGSYMHMLARAVPVRDVDGSIREWVGTHTDITQRKRAVESRNRFYAAMSHELRTPINAILGYADLLLAGAYGSLTEVQIEGLERSQRAARHLLELVNDVLDLSKLEAGKLTFEKSLVNLPELLQDLFATVQPLAEEQGSDLELMENPCEKSIRTDPRRVRQILLNLLSNAIKFGEGKPVRVRCLPTADGGVAVEVIDHGPGIPEDDIPRIFEEFVQLGSEPRGTGLGLPISRSLAELLGGSLEVESKLGERSTFTLQLPAGTE